MVQDSVIIGSINYHKNRKGDTVWTVSMKKIKAMFGIMLNPDTYTKKTMKTVR